MSNLTFRISEQLLIVALLSLAVVLASTANAQEVEVDSSDNTLEEIDAKGDLTYMLLKDTTERQSDLIDCLQALQLRVEELEQDSEQLDAMTTQHFWLESRVQQLEYEQVVYLSGDHTEACTPMLHSHRTCIGNVNGSIHYITKEYLASQTASSLRIPPSLEGLMAESFSVRAGLVVIELVGGGLAIYDRDHETGYSHDGWTVILP